MTAIPLKKGNRRFTKSEAAEVVDLSSKLARLFAGRKTKIVMGAITCEIAIMTALHSHHGNIKEAVCAFERDLRHFLENLGVSIDEHGRIDCPGKDGRSV